MHSCAESRCGRAEGMNRLIAAAFDLDDTLLRDDLSISPYTVDVFHRLHASGFLFIAASGRTSMSMKSFVDELGCVSLCISCNGAEIWDPASGRVLSREMFSAELGREIAAFGNEYGCYAQTYSDEMFFFNEYSEYSDRYAAASRLPGKYVGNLVDFIREPRSKILMMANEEKIAAMLSVASERFENRASVTCSKPYFLEFNPIAATKGLALEKAAALLGIPLSGIAAFGDSLNDLPMMKAAGCPVAVQNARPEVRAFCGECCASNQEDGVARYLASKVLKEVNAV